MHSYIANYLMNLKEFSFTGLSAIFRVQCFCTDLYHNIALHSYYKASCWKLLSATTLQCLIGFCLHVIVNSCLKWLKIQKDLATLARYLISQLLLACSYRMNNKQTLTDASNLANFFTPTQEAWVLHMQFNDAMHSGFPYNS